MAQLEDFGEKIGGARKDIWKERNLMEDDLIGMTGLERQKYVTKDYVWPKPDWVSLVKDGTPQLVAFWQNKMRQSIPPKPRLSGETEQNNYVHVVNEIRDAVMQVRTKEEINHFYEDYLKPAFISSERGRYVTISDEANAVITDKVLRAAQTKYLELELDSKALLFAVPKDEQAYVAAKNALKIHKYSPDTVSMEYLYSDKSELEIGIKYGFGTRYSHLKKDHPFFDKTAWKENTYFVFDTSSHKPVAINFSTEKEAMDAIEEIARGIQNEADKADLNKSKNKSGKRKTHFKPPQLAHIRREGPHYRGIRAANHEMFLNDLKFRGGEYGNWLNELDRQTSLDMAYDAFRDLARVLHIRPEDVSLNNTLSIAFGARGRGGQNAAAAHYEPALEVINLTKMTGAGCLAHEWGHALDHAVGKHIGMIDLASEGGFTRMPKSMADIMTSMKYKTVSMDKTAGKKSEELQKNISRAKKVLEMIIVPLKPENMSEEWNRKWNEAIEDIMNSCRTFEKGAYFKLRPDEEVITIPHIEFLSQICTLSDCPGINMDKKREIAMWSYNLAEQLKEKTALKGSMCRVETDFYIGSKKFDEKHSRAAHGYWSQDCEMFARAFDCYVADKLKAEGNVSQFLSGYSDSYHYTDEDGGTVSAVPEGEERKLLNEKFDIFLAEIKELGILHDYEEVLVQEVKQPIRFSKPDITEMENPENSEQMSFDELLFSAEKRSRQTASCKVPKQMDEYSR